MKKSIIIILIGLFIAPYINYAQTTETFTYTQYRDYDISYDENGQAQQVAHWRKFKQVYIDCEYDRCNLICRGVGDLPCTWAQALGWNAEDNKEAFSDYNCQNIFDYVHSKVVDLNFDDTYSSNYIKADGTQVFRSITWELLPGTSTIKSVLTLSIIHP